MFKDRMILGDDSEALVTESKSSSQRSRTRNAFPLVPSGVLNDRIADETSWALTAGRYSYYNTPVGLKPSHM